MRAHRFIGPEASPLEIASTMAWLKFSTNDPFAQRSIDLESDLLGLIDGPNDAGVNSQPYLLWLKPNYDNQHLSQRFFCL